MAWHWHDHEDRWKCAWCGREQFECQFSDDAMSDRRCHACDEATRHTTRCAACDWRSADARACQQCHRWYCSANCAVGGDADRICVHAESELQSCREGFDTIGGRWRCWPCVMSHHQVAAQCSQCTNYVCSECAIYPINTEDTLCKARH